MKVFGGALSLATGLHVAAAAVAGVAFAHGGAPPLVTPAPVAVEVEIEPAAPAAPPSAPLAPPLAVTEAPVRAVARRSATVGPPPPAPVETGQASDRDVAPAGVAPAAVPDVAVAPPRFHMVLGAGFGSSVAGPVAAAPVAAPAIVDASRVTEPARLIASVTPAYPAAAREEGVEGDVPLEIVLDETGRVVSARAVRHAGYGLDESALVAIRSYRFRPARLRGAPVRVRMRWDVQFRLR